MKKNPNLLALETGLRGLIAVFHTAVVMWALASPQKRSCIKQFCIFCDLSFVRCDVPEGPLELWVSGFLSLISGGLVVVGYVIKARS